MSILAALAREHRLFERLIEQVRRGIELPAEEAAPRIRDALSILLPALERHDAIETIVFTEPDASSSADEKRAHQLVDDQHEALRALREDLLAVIEAKEASLSRLKSLADLLAGRLEWHFKTEEMLLWPFQAKRCSRSLGQSVEHRARKSVQELEEAVARQRALGRH